MTREGRREKKRKVPVSQNGGAQRIFDPIQIVCSHVWPSPGALLVSHPPGSPRLAVHLALVPTVTMTVSEDHQNRTVLYTVEGFFAMHRQRKTKVSAGQRERVRAHVHKCVDPLSLLGGSKCTLGTCASVDCHPYKAIDR